MLYACLNSIARGITLALVINIMIPPQGALAWFAFGKDNYQKTTLPWESDDMTITFLISLQSCYGLSSSGGFLSCEAFNRTELYYLTGSNFTLVLQDKINPSDPDLDISRVTFNEGSNKNIIISNQETNPGLSPYSYTPVDAEVTFTINHEALSVALPGTYRSSFSLQGAERGGWGTYTDQTKFIFDVDVPKRVKISGLKDISLQSDGSGTIRSNWESFCVFAQGGEAFKLRAFGSDNSGAFILKQGDEKINYRLRMRSTINGNPENIEPSKTHSIYQWTGSNNQDCNGNTQNNMELRVIIPSEELSNVSSGVYMDTVTVIVEPT